MRNTQSLNTENSLIQPKRKAALRLVSTKDMPREEWLAQRDNGIGASEAATAIGLNPYMSPLELWMIKTGRDKEMPKVDPDDDRSPMFWGNVLEPVVAKCYTKRTGNKVRRVNAILQHPDTDKAWMIANLDYAITGSDEVQILECKTSGGWGTKLWKDGVPEYYQLQVQHQLAVTGYQAADLSVLLNGNDLQIYRIERDDELIARLIELERRFWHYVETDTAPPADGSESAGKALQYLFPHDHGAVLDYSENTELNETFGALVAIRKEIASITHTEECLKQTLQQQMGDATKAVFSNGSITWKRSKDSVRLDTKALLDAQPELIHKFGKIYEGSRRFLIQQSA